MGFGLLGLEMNNTKMGEPKYHNKDSCSCWISQSEITLRTATKQLL
jgi:hypothetical protein